MKTLGLALIVCGLVLAAVPAFAQETGQTSFTLVGKPNAGGFAWFLNGAGSPNPTLTVPANTEITFTVSSADDTPHTFKASDKSILSTPFAASDGAQTAKWTSGAADTTYECTLHPDMKGTIHVAGAAATKKSPGLQVAGVVVAMLGAALFVARRSK
jgi:plastocyanin